MKRHDFSLIELLVVIAILGALVSMVLPSFNNVQDDARNKVMRTEMREIQSAVRRFNSDTGLQSSNSRLTDLATYGLWPLMMENHPDDTVAVSYPNYDPEIGIGRRGPYLRSEGMELINVSGAGQPAATSGIDIPVIKDPYGGYYRVMMPSAGFDREKRIVLICSGPDTTLDTTVGTDSEITAQGDDYVIRLLPLSTW